MRKKIRVAMSMGRGSHDGHGRARLEITDATSGALVMFLEMTSEELGDLLLSAGPRAASAEVFDTFDRLGKVRESKNLLVMVPVAELAQAAESGRTYQDGITAQRTIIDMHGRLATEAIGDGWVWGGAGQPSQREWDDQASTSTHKAFRGHMVRFVESDDLCAACALPRATRTLLCDQEHGA